MAFVRKTSLRGPRGTSIRYAPAAALPAPGSSGSVDRNHITPSDGLQPSDIIVSTLNRDDTQTIGYWIVDGIYGDNVTLYAADAISLTPDPFDAAHPVGSLYTSTTPVVDDILSTGTWERLPSVGAYTYQRIA